MNRIVILLVSLVCSTFQGELFFTPKMISSHLSGYTDQEIQQIVKDLKVVRSVCLDGTRNTESRFYLATAGGPGACKTTILEKFVSSHPEYQDGVYLDPDPRTLKYMVHTYHQSLSPLIISQTENYNQAIKNAYYKWRYASNYIVLTLFEEAYAKGRSIIYGTTSTGSHVSSFFTKLKENGYQTVLLLCSCPDEVRHQAVEYRNNVIRFYQSSPEDAVAKGKFFAERMGVYFAQADLMYLYWSDSLFAPERLAAIWRNGTLEVQDRDAMQKFADKYEMDRAALEAEGQQIPPFDSLIQAPQ